MIDTDEVLLNHLNSGDNEAFEMIFLRHYERVYRVVYNLVGSREEAEDIVQETFLVLHHRPPHSVSDSGLAAWLCRVALNRGYNTLRNKRRLQQRANQCYEVLGSDDPYREVERSEERTYVQSLLARLPERQRSILLLRYAGLSYAEIAATLEISPGSVGTLLARAERAFAKLCQDPIVVL